MLSTLPHIRTSSPSPAESPLEVAHHQAHSDKDVAVRFCDPLEGI